MLSVVIITSNREKDLEICLQSLSLQKSKNFEVVIIDNASVDNTKKIIQKFKKTLSIKYFFEKKIGIPYARNRALKEVKGDIIAFIDDDCQAVKNWTSEIIKAHQKYPNIIAIQGKQISIQNKFIQKYITFPYDAWVKRNTVNRNDLLICDTKNLSLKRNGIEKYSLWFDTNYDRGSDVDFAKQLLSKGQTIRYYPSIKVFHRERKTILAALKQRVSQDRAYPLQRMKWPSFLFPEYNVSSNPPQKKSIILKWSEYFYNHILSPDYEEYLKKNRVKIILSREKIQGNISVVIVTRNRASLLKECLSSLETQTVLPSEVIVIDNASTDDTKKIIFSFKSILPIRYLHEKKVGIPYGRNRGLFAAKAEIVAYIDDDCEAKTTWIEEMIHAHKKSSTVVAIQGNSKVIKPKSILALFSEFAYQHWIAGRIFNDTMMTTVVTSNVSFKKDMLLHSGISFDTRFFRYFRGEDSDLGSQIIASGLQISFNRNAEIFYHPRTSLLGYIRQRCYSGRGNALLIQKWPNYFKSHQEIKNFSLWNILSVTQKYKYPYLVFISWVYRSIYDVGFVSEFAILKYIDIVGEKTFKKEKNIHKQIINLSLKIALEDHYKKKNWIFKKISFLLSRAFTYRLLKTYKKNYVSLFTRNDILSFSNYSNIPALPISQSLTIGITTKNRPLRLYYCLLSLASQRPFQANEILVVNNGSNDETTILLNFLARRIRLKIYFLDNKGIAVARNKLLKEAKGQIFAFIDDDVIVPNTWLLETIVAHKKYPEAIALQGRSMNVPRANMYGQLLNFLKQNMMRQNTALSFDEYINIIVNPTRKGYSFFTLDTRNCSFKVGKFKKLNIFFDKTFFRDEDTDLGKRIIEKKGKILFYPQIFVYHYDRDALFPFIYKNFMRGRSGYNLEKKWFKNKTESYNTFYYLWSFLRTQYIKNTFMLIQYILVFNVYIYAYSWGYGFEKYKSRLKVIF